VKKLLFLTIFSATITLGSPQPFYIDTQGKQGVFLSFLDSETGELSTPTVEAKLENPNSPAYDKASKLLLATNFHRNKQTKKSWNTLHSFHIDSDYRLSSRGANHTNSHGACYLSFSPSGKQAFVAHFGPGTISSFNINEYGTISPAISTFTNTGSSIHPTRQRQALAHAIIQSPTSPYIYSTDLGTDEVLVFKTYE